MVSVEKSRNSGSTKLENEDMKILNTSEKKLIADEKSSKKINKVSYAQMVRGSETRNNDVPSKLHGMGRKEKVIGSDIISTPHDRVIMTRLKSINCSGNRSQPSININGKKVGRIKSGRKVRF